MKRWSNNDYVLFLPTLEKEIGTPTLYINFIH
jgi:hypothetical protein